MENCDGNVRFKVLKPDNWRRQDPIGCDPLLNPGRLHHRKLGDLLAAEILSCELNPGVPIDARELFKVARGILCYGHFFYPLYSVGCDQLYRVLEAVVRHKCLDLAPEQKFRDYSSRIEWLHQQGTILEADRWNAARYLRNEASHLKE